MVELSPDRHVFVRALTVGETRRWVKACKEDSNEQSFTILAVLGLCDENGKRMFADGDVEAVSESLSFEAGKKIAEAVLEASGLSDSEPKN